jgi:hypothetical protein
VNVWDKIKAQNKQRVLLLVSCFCCSAHTQAASTKYKVILRSTQSTMKQNVEDKVINSLIHFQKAEVDCDKM